MTVGCFLVGDGWALPWTVAGGPASATWWLGRRPVCAEVCSAQRWLPVGGCRSGGTWDHLGYGVGAGIEGSGRLCRR